MLLNCVLQGRWDNGLRASFLALCCEGRNGLDYRRLLTRVLRCLGFGALLLVIPGSIHWFIVCMLTYALSAPHVWRYRVWLRCFLEILLHGGVLVVFAIVVAFRGEGGRGDDDSPGWVFCWRMLICLSRSRVHRLSMGALICLLDLRVQHCRV
jgi:hypothetical protein